MHALAHPMGVPVAHHQLVVVCAEVSAARVLLDWLCWLLDPNLLVAHELAAASEEEPRLPVVGAEVLAARLDVLAAPDLMAALTVLAPPRLAVLAPPRLAVLAPRLAVLPPPDLMDVHVDHPKLLVPPDAVACVSGTPVVLLHHSPEYQRGPK